MQLHKLGVMHIHDGYVTLQLNYEQSTRCAKDFKVQAVKKYNRNVKNHP